MRQTSRTFAVAVLAVFAVASVGATVLAFPVPPLRDEATLMQVSSADSGYGVNDVRNADCRLARLDTVDAQNKVHSNFVRMCD